MTRFNSGERYAPTDAAMRRLFEWGLLAILIAVIVWAVFDKARDLRSAAELNAFRYSLGALRVALVLDQMKVEVSGVGAESAAARNPFTLLERRPVTYLGDVTVAAAEAGAIVPGTWFYDEKCPCIGYRPRDDRRFLAASGSPVMLFRLTPARLLPAREPYLWRGELVD